MAASFAFAISCADSSSGDDTGDDGSDDVSMNVCGDGICAAAEAGYCMQDCGTGGNNNAAQCGNGTCESEKGETSASCAQDCGGGGSGSGSSTACPSDPTECAFCVLLDDGSGALCPPGMDIDSCTACISAGLGGGGGLGSGGFGDLLCEGGAADGVCNAAALEDPTTCPSDCP